MGRRASDPDPRARRVGAEEEGLSIRFSLIALRIKGSAQELKGFVGQSSSFMAINPDRPKFGAHPSDPPTDFEATAGELLDRRDRFYGGQCRWVGHDEDRGADADPLGRCGEPGERGEGIEVATPDPSV